MELSTQQQTESSINQVFTQAINAYQIKIRLYTLHYMLSELKWVVS